MLQSLRKNKVVKNAGWIIGGKVANKLLAFVVGIFAARYLGPSNYGLINYAAAYAAFFASLCTLGINSVIVKNFVDHPDQQGETIGTTLLLRAISSLLSALAIIGIVSVVDRGERLTIVVVALYSIGLIFQVFDTLNYWFQARLQSKYSAIAELVSYAAMSVYKIILLALGKSVEWFAVASALDYIVLAVFLLIAYFKNGGTRFRYSLEKAKELLQSLIREKDMPPKPTLDMDMAEFRRMKNLMIKAQEGAREIRRLQDDVLPKLKAQLADTKGLFKGKERKALSEQIQQTEKEIAAKLDMLPDILKEDGYPDVQAFMRTFREMESVVEQYSRDLAEWERQTSRKPSAAAKEQRRPPEKQSVLKHLREIQDKNRQKPPQRQRKKSIDRDSR